jgi:hypothetical protein
MQLDTPSPEGCSANTSARRRRDEGSIDKTELEGMENETYASDLGDGDGPITPLFLDDGVRLIQRYFGVEEGTGLGCSESHFESKSEADPKSRAGEQSDLGLEWKSKGQRKGVSVSSSMVRGSTWQVGSIPRLALSLAPAVMYCLNFRNVTSTLSTHLLA